MTKVKVISFLEQEVYFKIYKYKKKWGKENLSQTISQMLKEHIEHIEQEEKKNGKDTS